MKKIFESIVNIFKIKDIRSKLLFTFAMLIVYRIGSYIPVPGLDKGVFQSLVAQTGSTGVFGLMDIFTGGSFSNSTIFALSVSPYINSSIIMQLLTVAIPALERLQKEGDEGRKIIQKWVRYVAVILAFIEGSAITWSIRTYLKQDLTVLSFFMITVTLTAGTAFIMWLGEKITEKGITNGISMIIFVNIISRGPSAFYAIMQYYTSGKLGPQGIVAILAVIGILVMFFVVIALVVWVNDAERRIPIQYAKRVVGRKMYGGQSTHIPIKVNWAGVIPIIFAMSITALPSTLVGFIAPNSTNAFVVGMKNWPGTISYSIVFAVLIMLFSFFYTYIQFNPVEIANNVKKNGGFIPGIRPGKPTADYIGKVLRRLTWFGGLFLAAVQLLPSILGAATGLNGLWLGGSSVLIMVGVAVDIVRAVESQMMMRNYKGFLDS